MGLVALVPFIVYGVVIGALTYFLYQRNHNPRPWKAGRNPFDQIFLKHVMMDRFWGGNEEFREILSKILAAYNQDDCTAVLVTFGKNRFQMLEFDAESGPILHKDLPMIPISRWGHAADEKSALAFLKKTDGKDDASVEKIVCSSEDTFRAFFEHVAPTCRATKEVDEASRCPIYRGYLSPKKV